jgi:hypothetical protein
VSKREIVRTSIASLIALLLLGALAIVMASGTPASAAPSVAGPASVEGADSWTWRGPSHFSGIRAAPEIKHIAIDPTNPSIVYASTNQGVYRSANAGETWEPRNGGLGGYGDLVVSWLAVDPTNHQRLLIGTWGYGLFQSTDSGANWSRLTDPLAALAAQAAPPTGPEPPPVRAGGPSDVHEPEGLPAEPNKLRPEGVSPLASRLAGEERPASVEGLPNALPWTPVRQVAIDPSNTAHLYACIEKGSQGGLFESWNGGGSWSPVSVGTGNCRTITIAPSNASIRYASFGTWSTDEGLYRSTNGGSSWDPVGGGTIGGTVVALAIHPSNTNIVLAATSGGGIYRSLTGGSGWTNVSTELGETTFYSIGFAPSNPTVAYAGGYTWVYRSGDTGDSWANADASFPTYYVQGLAIHPYSSSTVLVGANIFPFGGVYKRTSDGSSFAFKPTGMTDTFVLDLEQDPNDPNVLYAATWGGGVFRSEDGGVTWNVGYGGKPYVYSLEATQGPTGTILYGTTFYSDYGILKSYDRGDSWEEVSRGWWSDISFDIESVDGGSQSLVVATYHGVERSDDGGATWALASGLDQGVVLSVARSPANPNRWLAATWGGGIWLSNNGGFGWTESSTGLASPYVYDVAYSPSYPDTVYAASLGVHRSSNGGSTWSVSGIRGAYIRALDTLGAPYNDAFAGTHDRGVFMAPNRIDWWFPINSGLAERRIRSVEAVTADKLFAGTNGQGAWEYTIVNRPEPKIRLPMLARNWSTVVLPDRLYSIADATVLQAAPSYNFGSTTDMWVGYDHCEPAQITRSLIRFDTSAIPPGTSISQARLSIYLTNSCDIGERTHRVAARVVTGNWSESTVTWNSQPGFGAEYGSTSIPSRSWGRYQIDVTSLVRGWVNGTISNRGLILRSNESSGTDSARLGFRTREMTGTTYDPYLTITYAGRAGVEEITVPAGGSPEPTTFGPTIHDSLSGLLTTPDTPPAGYIEQSVDVPE